MWEFFCNASFGCLRFKAGDGKYLQHPLLKVKEFDSDYHLHKFNLWAMGVGHSFHRDSVYKKQNPPKWVFSRTSGCRRWGSVAWGTGDQMTWRELEMVLTVQLTYEPILTGLGFVLKGGKNIGCVARGWSIQDWVATECVGMLFKNIFWLLFKPCSKNWVSKTTSQPIL